MKCRNLEGTIQLVTAPSTADTLFAVAHELGEPPHGAMVVRRSHASAQLYRPLTAEGADYPWDETYAYFKSSVASVQFYVLFF